jgi:hypothetical protein
MKFKMRRREQLHVFMTALIDPTHRHTWKLRVGCDCLQLFLQEVPWAKVEYAARRGGGGLEGPTYTRSNAEASSEDSESDEEGGHSGTEHEGTVGKGGHEGATDTGGNGGNGGKEGPMGTGGYTGGLQRTCRSCCAYRQSLRHFHHELLVHRGWGVKVWKRSEEEDVMAEEQDEPVIEPPTPEETEKEKWRAKLEELRASKEYDSVRVNGSKCNI